MLQISFFWHSGIFWFWTYIYSWVYYNCPSLFNLKYGWVHILSSWCIHYQCKLNTAKKKKVSYFPHAYSLAGGKDHTQSQCLLKQFACICPLFNVSGHLSFRIISVSVVTEHPASPNMTHTCDERVAPTEQEEGPKEGNDLLKRKKKLKSKSEIRGKLRANDWQWHCHAWSTHSAFGNTGGSSAICISRWEFAAGIRDIREKNYGAGELKVCCGQEWLKSFLGIWNFSREKRREETFSLFSSEQNLRCQIT